VFKKILNIQLKFQEVTRTRLCDGMWLPRTNRFLMRCNFAKLSVL